MRKQQRPQGSSRCAAGKTRASSTSSLSHYTVLAGAGLLDMSLSFGFKCISREDLRVSHRTPFQTANKHLTCELWQVSHPLTGAHLWGLGVCWEVSLQPQRAAITEFTQVINMDAA